MDIRHYLPYYLGQEVQTSARKESSKGKPMGYKIGKLCEIDNRCQQASVDVDDVPIDFNFSELTLILRPVNSMTNEEFEIKNKLCFLHKLPASTKDGKQAAVIHDSPESFAWMIKQGFDIFNLHSNGLCLYRDKEGKLY